MQSGARLRLAAGLGATCVVVATFLRWNSGYHVTITGYLGTSHGAHGFIGVISRHGHDLWTASGLIAGLLTLDALLSVAAPLIDSHRPWARGALSGVFALVIVVLASVAWIGPPGRRGIAVRGLGGGVGSDPHAFGAGQPHAAGAGQPLALAGGLLLLAAAALSVLPLPGSSARSTPDSDVDGAGAGAGA